MARMTDNDAVTISGIDESLRAAVLYDYLAKGMKQAPLGEKYFNTEGSFAGEPVSALTRSFGFHQGAGRGKYGHVPREAFDDFVMEYYPENIRGGLDTGTFDKFLRDWYARNSQDDDEYDEDEDYDDEDTFVPLPPPSPRPNPTPRPTPSPHIPIDIGGGSRPQRTYVNSTPDLGPFAPILLLVAVCVLLWGAGKVMDFGRGAIFAGKQMVGSVNSFLSAEYQAEIYEYEGREYFGNQRFNKPEGACMRFDGGADYTIGYFEGAELNGYGIIVRENGDDLKAGIFKKNVLNGYAILRCNGVDYVANFKKGEANGYGYRYDHGKEQIVKFKDVSSELINFSPTEIVAERSGDQWLKPNGKPLKMKDNTYKGITWIREGLISIGDVEYYFDAEVNEAYYNSPEARLSWDYEGCEYDSILSDDEGTWLYYTTDVDVEGKHQYYEKDDLLINTFSASISVG